MKKTAKIAIILVILALVALMFFLKNGFGTEEAQESVPVASAPAEAETIAHPAEEKQAPVTEEKPAQESEESKAEEKAEAPAAPAAEEKTEEATTVASSSTRLPMTQEVFDMEKWLEPGLPLLVDFGSKSCGPCQKMKPDLIKFYEAVEGKMTVVYLDVWEDPARTGGLPANVVPTQYFFNADGSPYIPTDEFANQYADRYWFLHYTLKGSDDIVLTGHQGMLLYDDLVNIAGNMGVTL